MSVGPSTPEGRLRAWGSPLTVVANRQDEELVAIDLVDHAVMGIDDDEDVFR